MYVDYGFATENRDAEEQQALLKAMALEPADLTENRRGRISARQRSSLLWRGGGLLGRLLLELLPLLVLLVMLGCVVTLGMHWGHLSQNRFRLRHFLGVIGREFWVAQAIGTLLMCLSGVLGRQVISFLRLVQLARDLALTRVTCYCGRLTTNRSEDLDGLFRSQTVRHYVCANGTKYEVRQEAHDELYASASLGYYKLYLTPHSDFLLALEPATVSAQQAHLDLPVRPLEKVRLLE